MCLEILKLKSLSKLLLIGSSRNYFSLSQQRCQKSTLVSQESLKSFNSSLPTIIDKVFMENSIPVEIVKRIKQITEHNLGGGKKLRGTLTLHAYETIEKPENINEQSLRQIHTLAWAVEMVHSYFIILDDIEDGATTRRGKPCWHLLPEVGNQVINDASLFRSFLYEMLKQNFKDKSSYIDIVHLLNKAFYYTAIGQFLSGKTAANNRNFESFTIEKYNTIVENKTTSYTIKVPVLLAMVLANKDTNCNHHLDNIFTALGRLFQMQDDYLDCYGDIKNTGKTHTDIQEGKCSWLAVTALQRCSPTQRTVFTACYGSKEPAHIERIKQLYDTLQLPEIYRNQTRDLHDDVLRTSKSLSNVNPELFVRLLDTIYDRSC